MGTLWVYVPSRTTVWYALAFWTNWLLKQSNFANSAGMGTVSKPLSTHLGEMSLRLDAVLQYVHMNSFLHAACGSSFRMCCFSIPHIVPILSEKRTTVPAFF